MFGINLLALSQLWEINRAVFYRCSEEIGRPEALSPVFSGARANEMNKQNNCCCNGPVKLQNLLTRRKET